MIDSMMEAMGFKRVAVVEDNVIKPVEFQCPVCGDWHEDDDMPRLCETGDGE